MKKTALYETHIASGGKMVPFAGWSMPIHYGSQLEEHHAVRQSVGIFDVSHMQLFAVEGDEARTFIRHLVSNDINKLHPGKALYTCLLNDEGGILDDLIVYQLTESRYTLVVNAGTAEKDLNWIREKSNGFEVVILPFENQALIAVQGPDAKALLDKADFYTDLKPFHCHEHRDYFIARTGYTGEHGFEIALPNARVASVWAQLTSLGAMPCGLGARDTLRLEAGLNLYGQDMDETTNPFESNLAWTVDLKDLGREFIGRPALERILQHGVEKKLVGLILTEQGIMRTGMSLNDVAGAPMGVITSGGFSPTLNFSIALARIKQCDLNTLQVELRHKKMDVNIVHPPFIRAGKATFEIKK